MSSNYSRRFTAFIPAIIIMIALVFGCAHTTYGLLSSISNVSETEGSSVAPQVATSANGRIYVVWSDDTDSSGEILFSFSDNEGENFSEHVNVSNDTSTSVSPQIAVSGDNVFLVWYGNILSENSEVYFSTSTDGGENFSAPINLSNNTGSSTNPQIAILDEDTIFIVWEDNDPSISNSTSNEIVFRKSTDAGMSFGELVNISQSDAHSTSPRVASSSSGKVYVAWEDSGAGSIIKFSASTESTSNSFSIPAELGPGIGFSIKLRAMGADDVYVSWSDFAANKDVFFASSHNAGNSFNVVNISRNNPSVSTSPEFAISDDEHIWLVWNDKEEGDGDVYLANSTDNGATFSTGLNLSNNTFPSAFPQIAISDDGSSLYAVWQNDLDAGGTRDIFFSGSTDAGDSFTTPANVAINPELSESQAITMIQNRLLVVWSDSSPGNPEVLFRTMSLDIPTITIEEISDRAPKWGTTIELVGIASDSGSDTVTVDWGDGSESEGLEVVGNTWSAIHDYESDHVGNRTVLAKLVRDDGTEDGTSNPEIITVAKRATSLVLTHTGSGIQGTEVRVAGELVDMENGEGVGSMEVTFSGTGGSDIHSATTGSDGTFQALGISPNSTGSLWTIQAHFDGSSEYHPSDSDVGTFDTVPPTASQFHVPEGSPSEVTLTGFNTTIEFDDVISEGTIYVTQCGEEPKDQRFISIGLCLTISSSAELGSESNAHIKISFAAKQIPAEHIVSEIDIFHETISGIVDITESRDEYSKEVTGLTSSFSNFIVGIAVHEQQPSGSARQQLYVGSDQQVVFFPDVKRTVEFDSSKYEPGSSPILTVNDPTANLDRLAIDVVNAEVSSTSDRSGINITLSETGKDTGIFAGTFNLNKRSSSESNAELEYQGGDKINAAYTMPYPRFEVVFEGVKESGILQLSRFNITGVAWQSIGTQYELEFLDGALEADRMVVTMSYSDVNIEGLAIPFILVYMNDTLLEPTWQDITTDADTSTSSVTGVSDLFTKFAIAVSDSFPTGGGGGGGLPRPGTGILLDTTATVLGEENSDRNHGGSTPRSSAISSPPVGTNVNTSIKTDSGTVTINFENVHGSSTQLRVNMNELAAYEDIFDMLIPQTPDNPEHGTMAVGDTVYSTAGKVFDIDGSSVQFDGIVAITIPYDESLVSLTDRENEVRFLHFNSDTGHWEDKTKSVDIASNTVTGQVDSLSPVVAAIIMNDHSDSGSDLESNISSRMEIGIPSVDISESGNATISTSLRNSYSDAQDYVMIIQAKDDIGVVQYLGWQKASLQSNGTSVASLDWNNLTKGTYSVQILLITDLENPWLLSEPLTMPLWYD
ncbi:MAG TPA: sialidase family protein [Nitrososphaera sp.]|nr:sialidase family protein [Nitrososphaera sp.]